MNPRYPNPMMHTHFLTAFAVVHWVCGLIVLAGFVFFLITAWRFMRAHERIASTLKDVDVVTKPKNPGPKD